MYTLSELLSIFLINLEPWWFIIITGLFVLFVAAIIWVVVKFYKRKKIQERNKEKHIHDGR